jgi:hypothetical protein
MFRQYIIILIGCFIENGSRGEASGRYLLRSAASGIMQGERIIVRFMRFFKMDAPPQYLGVSHSARLLEQYCDWLALHPDA